MNSIWELLEPHEKKQESNTPAVRPTFRGVEGYDVYNPTKAFDYKGKKMICARV